MHRLNRSIPTVIAASLLCLSTVLAGAASAVTAGGTKGDPQPELKPFKIGTATSAGNVAIAPYFGAYADSYFGKDNAAATVPAALLMDGTSARLTGGVAFVTDSGARLTAGAEVGGLAGNFTAWSVRARGSLPF